MGEELTRRKWLNIFVKAVSSIVALALSIPTFLMLVIPAFRKGQAPWIRVGPLSDFRPNEPKAVTLSYQRRDGWVIKTARTTVYVVVTNDGKVKVLSNICTHAGCVVQWERNKRAFHCPCHEGYFAIDGSVISGPPSRPLDEFLHKIEGGELFVRLKI